MSWMKSVIKFYYEGFRNMPKWGRAVWIIIILKLFIMFAALKVFFFPNYLNTNFDTDEQRSEHVLDKLTSP